MAKYLDYSGVSYLWTKIKGAFAAIDHNHDGDYIDAASSVTSGHVATWGNNGHTLVDSGRTLGRDVAAASVFSNEVHIDVDGAHIALTDDSTHSGFKIYSLPLASNTAGVIKTSSAVSDVSDPGFHAVPIVNGVPFYYDTVYTHPTITQNDTTSTASPSHGDSFTAVDSVTRDGMGHVTGINLKTITLPSLSADLVTAAANLPENEIILGAGSKTVKSSGKTIVTTLGADDSTIPTSKAVADAIAGLSGAMHFIGVTTDTMTDGQTTNPTVSGVTTFHAGDVVVDATETEFVLGKESTPKWHKLGDAKSYALNSITITGAGELGGGGDLTQNRTITHNTSGVTAGTYGSETAVAGITNRKVTKVASITVNAYGHITSASEVTIEALTDADIDAAIAAAV